LKNKGIFIVAFCILLVSCSENFRKAKESAPVIHELFGLKSSEKILQAKIGDERAVVITKIKSHLVSEAHNKLATRTSLDIHDSAFYEIDYDFKEGKLSSMDLDIYPKTLNECQELFTNFGAYYDSVYGEGQVNEKFMVWYTKSNSGNDVEIMLMNESKSHQKPYLAITFYEEENISR